jgi:hypothetical protein
MRSFKWLVVLVVSFVFIFSVVAASKEETKSPAPAGTAQTAGEEKAQDKDDKTPVQPGKGTAPGVKAPAPPVKVLKDEGC